ncbi:outer membrane protein [Sinorhizobium alkalisoli]|uniref:outer membrane protein n=1 Tax=Sinorhizobium alkalisoli TaxID=1752398 RepID=UPI000AC1DF7B|nr:outer membrane protein [Sinorhizobium alkalisoli]MCA1492465.1 porin family protein [Ensifer sp. NBAIM29]QFI67556.1 putative heat resistant agglutinin 1 signal peptide protein [Sinorhizobium alkalisoli]
MDWRNGICGIALGAGLLLSGTAEAADEDLLDAPEITISPEGNDGDRLYLRGDIGYAPWSGEGDPYYRTFDGAGYETVPFDNTRFGRPVSGTIGLGYQFTDIFRADVTAEYFEGRFDGASLRATPCAGEGAGTSCALSHSANFSALGLMANGYVDLATLAGFTPYVGAGLGATHIDWKTAHESSTCIAGLGMCAGSEGGASYQGRDGWRFAYALMAGVSYDVTDRLKLDMGYRFSYIAGGDMFDFGEEGFAGASGAKGHDDGLARHEFRVGLRLAFW